MIVRFPDNALTGKIYQDVGGQDVDGVVVDFFRSVGALAEGVELAEVTGAQPHFGGFYLHALEVALVLDCDIVAAGISPGPGHVEAQP